jgi:adenylate cyclase class 2
MKTEIEVKFLNIDLDQMREELKAAGAHLEQPMRLMRRALIEEPHHLAAHSFIRIRDEGDKITLTYKRRDDQAASKIDGTKEIEVEVSNFEDTIAIFKEAGWEYKTFQESKRETWQLGPAEVVIDEWPWLAPYIEIEAETEEQVKEAAAKLGLAWEDKLLGHIDAVYAKQYEFAENFRGVIDLKEVRFDDPLPSKLTPKEESNGP